MHLCMKLKLKLLKYSLRTDEGELVHLWPKILGYVSRLFLDIIVPIKQPPVKSERAVPVEPGRGKLGSLPATSGTEKMEGEVEILTSC